LAADSLQCLRALAGCRAGVLYLLKYHSLQALAQAYITQNEGTLSGINLGRFLGVLAGLVFLGGEVPT
jgi:hypothetical protein